MSPQTSNVAHWTRVSLRAKGVAVLAVPLAALFAALVAIHWLEGDVSRADLRVFHTYDVRAELVRLRGSLTAAENAMSGYFVTRQDRYLTLFETARTNSVQSLNRLTAL